VVTEITTTLYYCII